MINYGIAWYLLFLPLTRMGMEIVLSRDTGRNREKGDHTAVVTLALRIVSIIVVTVAYIIISLLFESDPASRLMVLVFAFALIGRSLAFWTGSVYIAYECNQYFLRQQAIFRSLEVALGLVVIFIWREALLVVAIHGLVWCLEAIYGLVIINRRVLVLRLEVKFADMSRVFTQGFALGVSMLLMGLPYQGPLVFFRHVVSSGDILGQLASVCPERRLPSSSEQVGDQERRKRSRLRGNDDSLFVTTWMLDGFVRHSICSLADNSNIRNSLCSGRRFDWAGIVADDSFYNLPGFIQRIAGVEKRLSNIFWRVDWRGLFCYNHLRSGREI
jgi:hypothetical protein